MALPDKPANDEIQVIHAGQSEIRIACSAIREPRQAMH
jgi:hypothetical protein